MEAEFIAYLRQRLPPHPQLLLGPGDDAAVLRLGEQADCVVTTDLLTDGVHFQLDRVEPGRAGRKCLAVNLSDLAAMAAKPVAAVVSLVVPREGGKQLAVDLFEGMLPLAEQFDVAIAGGDTNSWDGPLAVSITLIGQTMSGGPLLRGGAKPGDQIVVTGSFGGSILGRHLDFTPRVEEALLLAERYELHAGIDVSDGLSIDLMHLIEESGCGAVLETDRIPVSDAAEELARSSSDGMTTLDHALSDGEDFELILAVSPDEADRMLADQPLDVPLTRVGQFISEPGLWQQTASSRQPLQPHGYQHNL